MAIKENSKTDAPGFSSIHTRQQICFIPPIFLFFLETVLSWKIVPDQTQQVPVYSAQQGFSSTASFSLTGFILPLPPPEFWSCKITIHGNESRDKQLQSSLLQSIFPCIVSASAYIPLHLLRVQSVVLKSTRAE